MLMHRVHQDVRSSQLGIFLQRTIGRAALVTLKTERFKAPLLRRTISMGDCRSCIPRRNCHEHPKLQGPPLRDNRTVEGAFPTTL